MKITNVTVWAERDQFRWIAGVTATVDGRTLVIYETQRTYRYKRDARRAARRVAYDSGALKARAQAASAVLEK